jgi:hypothetical protein
LSGAEHVEVRQLVKSPWRMFYIVEKSRVVVVLIADGRRNLRQILLRRLTDA